MTNIKAKKQYHENQVSVIGANYKTLQKQNFCRS